MKKKEWVSSLFIYALDLSAQVCYFGRVLSKIYLIGWY